MNKVPHIPVLLYDGKCGLCNSIVKFLKQRRTSCHFLFISAQSSAGKAWLKNMGLPSYYADSVVYIKNNRFFTRSDACLVLLRDMKGLWRLGYGLKIIPKPIRDYFYDVVATNRPKICNVSNAPSA